MAALSVLRAWEKSCAASTSRRAASSSIDQNGSLALDRLVGGDPLRRLDGARAEVPPLPLEVLVGGGQLPPLGHQDERLRPAPLAVPGPLDVALEVLLEGPGVGVPVLLAGGEGLHADGLEVRRHLGPLGGDLRGGRNRAAARGPQDLVQAAAAEGRLEAEEGVEDGPQAEDVRLGIERLLLPPGLLGSHVGGGPLDRAGHRVEAALDAQRHHGVLSEEVGLALRLPEHLRQAPVHDLAPRRSRRP